MKQKPKIMSRYTMVTATEAAKGIVENALAKAKQADTDEERKTRVHIQECKACFYYGSRLGGATITERDCMCCGETQIYGGSATDALCKPCAIKHDLCRRCGGDIEMRVRRLKWPDIDKSKSDENQNTR